MTNFEIIQLLRETKSRYLKLKDSCGKTDVYVEAEYSKGEAIHTVTIRRTEGVTTITINNLY